MSSFSRTQAVGIGLGCEALARRIALVAALARAAGSAAAAPPDCSTRPRPSRRSSSIATARRCTRRGRRRHPLAPPRRRHDSGDRRSRDHRRGGSPLLAPPRRRSRSPSRARCNANIADGRSSKEDRRSPSRWPSCSSTGRRRSAGAAGAPKVHEAVVALRLEHRLHEARDSRALPESRRLTATRSSASSARARPISASSRRSLTAAQAAFLAGLPQRPTTFNPYRRSRSRAAAPARRAAPHEAAGVLTPPGRTRRARTAGVRAQSHRHSSRRTSSRWCSATAGTPRPSRIETTLDAQLQGDVDGIIRETARCCSIATARQRRRRRARQRDAANGSPGKAPATTSTPSMAGPSTVR